MKESKPIMGLYDRDEFTGVVWETEKGTVVTMSGKINPQMNLSIFDVETNKEITDIDWRNILMDILPVGK